MKKFPFLPALLILLLQACTHRVAFDYNTFLEKKQLWTGQDHRYYSFAYLTFIAGVSGYESNYHIISVSNYTETGYVTLYGDSYPSFVHMGTLWDEIEEKYQRYEGIALSLFDRGILLEGIEVHYDAVYHFPTNVIYRFNHRGFLLNPNTNWLVMAFTNH